MRKKGFTLSYLVTTIFLLTGDRLLAQRKDTLNEVKIIGTPNRSNDPKLNTYAPGQKLVTLDSNLIKSYGQQNIATLLSRETALFVRSYSSTGLNTLNFRGSSAAQSMVLWNGVPIQNAALGVADVSTLPVMFMNKVNLVYGSSGALLGSGNVGGALMLESMAPKYDSLTKSLTLSGGVGSFGMHLGALTFNYANAKWYLQLSAQWQEALNNFEYVNNAGAQARMTNSSLQSKALMVELGHRINEFAKLGVYVWYQHYDREIPPALFEIASVKAETDLSLRTLVTLDKIKGANRIYAKASLCKDDIDYNDPSVLVHTIATTYQYYQELGWDHNMGKMGRFLIFTPIQSSWMENAGPATGKSQTKLAFAGSYDLKTMRRKLDLALNVREEIVNNISILLPGAGVSLIVNKYLIVRAGAQKTYRVPTLNELYYFPGGNATLKPEQGWSQDGGYDLKMNQGKWKITHNLAIYNRNIQDWISWLGGAIWTPHNIAEVHSRGIETENRVEYLAGACTLHVGCNTAYVLATTTSSYLPNDGSIGKQIPYTPRYNGQLNLGLSFNRLWLNYNQCYTGYRNTVNDGSEYLTPYLTGNLQLMYSCRLHGHELQLNGQCNNLWNQHYMVAAYRPMPGTNWLTGIKLGIL